MIKRNDLFKMYNLNVSLSTPSLLNVDGGGNGGMCIPRTPEILNSLMAMTNPLEYSYSSSIQNQVSQQDSHSNSSDSPLNSPAGSGVPPSLQQTRSQLIKAGVKLLIQNKRKHSGGDSSENESIKQRRDTEPTSDDDTDVKSNKTLCLTPEDEDRRKRRRERNKIAATKCRMKKRERTVNLVSESEILENQNVDLKTQVRELENQRRKLLEVLQDHGPECVHHNGYQPLPSLSSLKSCKYLLDIGCDPHMTGTHSSSASSTSSPASSSNQEIKYSATLKRQHNNNNNNNNNRNNNNNINNNINNNNNDIIIGSCYNTKTNNYQPMHQLQPNYCKPSPTEINYVLSPDSGFVKSPSEAETLNNYHLAHIKNDYIPNCDANNGGLSNGVGSGGGGGGISSDTIISNGDQEFILKTEAIDSPYTTVQSANSFIYDNTSNFDSNDNKLTTASSLAIKDNASNAIMEYNSNYDAVNINKNDYLNHHHTNADFLASMVETNDTQFTDLDSGMTTYTNISNGGCLA